MQFSDLSLHADLARALSDLGYQEPTPIQAEAIPPAIEGQDVLGSAQTGTGKTAAFALPLLHRLADGDRPGGRTARGGKARGRVTGFSPRALILTPTRELAVQVGESFETYGRHLDLRTQLVFGGVSQFGQVKGLRNGIDILVATPGRLMDLHEQGHVDLTHIQAFVLDDP